MNKQLSLEDVQAVEEAGTVGTVVRNDGGELLLIPEADLKRVEGMAEPPDASDFDWSANRQDVVVPEQLAIACYWNPRGDLVIRQERSWCDDADSVIVVHPDNLQALIDRLCDMQGIPSAGKP